MDRCIDEEGGGKGRKRELELMKKDIKTRSQEGSARAN
jgi:hypothetical protein